MTDEGRLEQAFKAFDKDGNGKITKQELTYILQGDNDLVNEEAIEKLVEECDVDNDGEIDIHEFKRSITKRFK